MTKIENGILIGRFSPIHQGHIHMIGIAATQVNTLYILVGSANVCRSIKNPWTYQERAKMIKDKLWSARIDNVKIIPLNDYRYSDSQWITDVREIATHYNMGTPVLFGHYKEGNDYLKWFPDWKFKNVEAIHTVCATDIRNKMFVERDAAMPQTVQADWDYYQKETKMFSGYPYPDTLNFNCADAVIECQAHVLLIKRKFAPGKDSWALPGGFKNRNETFLDCAIRELQEETNIRVPEKVLRGCIVKTQLFDSPSRSYGIPRNTLAVYIKINPNPDGTLPRANGADDAAECKWVPIADVLNQLPLYDDHSDIISVMTGVMPKPAYLSV